MCVGKTDPNEAVAALKKWQADLIKELTDAGFVVKEHCGWPLVETPESFDGKLKLLKWKGTPANRTIYAEGVLFTPPGLKIR